MGSSGFRLNYLDPYDQAFHAWLHDEAKVIDTAVLTPSQAASEIAEEFKLSWPLGRSHELLSPS
jgi:hypothetical protein